MRLKKTVNHIFGQFYNTEIKRLIYKLGPKSKIVFTTKTATKYKLERTKPKTFHKKVSNVPLVPKLNFVSLFP